MREEVERLLDKNITTVEYHGGRKEGQVTSVENVDFDYYFWSGIIIGDRAIFIPNNYLKPKREEEKSEEEILEEAKYKTTQEMLDMWFGKGESRQER